MAESSNRQKDIFLKALDLPSTDQRAAFLAQACGSDESLRRNVEAMLTAHAAADSFLEKPAAALDLTVDASDGDPRTNALPSDGPGTRIGPYKLLEQIGEGGMGVVYMAEQQEPVRRTVALKIIKPGMDSGQVLARFEAERQALALMDHPNIARVLDAGATADARPFFVMELVKGTPITKFCDERRLNPRERLELFVSVCQAIQHAHQKGVIHRDIKPSNVLVALYDDKPVPKVIDFGVAKAAGQVLTEKTLHTGFGAIIGTPEYMSPEQATFNQLDIDTRSDVYSLGVLLYELLTGSTPVDKTRFKEAAILEVLRVVREEEPARPSVKLSTTTARASIAATRGTEADQLAQLLRGELDWIVMKSLEKDRNRRYETAAGLARDVDRYLKDELVEARPPSLGYRLRKSIRKNRGPVIAASLLFLALLVGVIGTTMGMFRAWDAEELTREANATIKENLREAQVLKNDALEAQKRAEANEQQAKENEGKAKENEKRANREALRADTARHAFQMDTIFRAWQRDDLFAASDALEEVPQAFRGTLEYRLVRDLCRRRGFPALAQNIPNVNLAISPDGKTIAALDGSDLAMVDAATGRERWKSPAGFGPPPIFDRSGKLISVREGRAGPYDQITIWNVETGEKRCTVKTAPFGSFGYAGQAFSPDGKLLAVPHLDGITVLDTAAGTQKLSIKKEAAWMERVAFSPDGKLLAGSGAKGLIIYNAENGEKKLAKPIDVERPNVLESRVVSFSSDSKRVLALVMKGPSERIPFVVVWDAESGTEKFATKPDPRAPRIRDVGFMADTKAIVMVTGDHDVKIVDLESGQERSAVGPLGPTTCASLDADGGRVSSYRFRYQGAAEKSILLWSLNKAELQTAWLPGAGGGEWPRQFTADSQQLCCGEEGLLTFWDARTGHKLRSLKLAPNYQGRLLPKAFSADGKRVMCHDVNQGLFKIFDTGSGADLLTVQCGPNARTMVFSPDGQRVATGPLIVVYNANTGQREFAIPGETGDFRLAGWASQDWQAFSPDGRQIAAFYARPGEAFYQARLGVWDAATGKQIATIQAISGSVLWFPDGKRLLTVSIPNSALWEVKLWDVQTGQEQVRFPFEAAGSDPYPRRPRVLTPDGTRLLGGNKIWDVATGQVVLTFPPDFFVEAISPDGRRILAKYENRLGIFEVP